MWLNIGFVKQPSIQHSSEQDLYSEWRKNAQAEGQHLQKAISSNSITNINIFMSVQRVHFALTPAPLLKVKETVIGWCMSPSCHGGGYLASHGAWFLSLT
jgi:hypothetical protein